MFTATMLPISRAQFDLDAEGDAKAILEAVRWLKVRSGVSFPSDAFSGEPFHTGLDAAAPAFAISTSVDDVPYWGAKLRFPDAAVPRRSWHTEIVIRRDARPSVAVRLAAFDDRESLGAKPPLRTVPGVVLQLVDNVGGLDGAIPLGSDFSHIESIGQFRELIVSSNRAMPVLAFGQAACEDWPAELETTAKKLAGICHVVVIDQRASHDIERHYARPFTVFGHFAKLYYPIEDCQQINAYDHPIFSLDNINPSRLISEVVRLTMSLPPPSGATLPRLTVLQQADRPAAGSGTDAALDLAAELEAELTAEIQARDELIDQAAKTERENASRLREVQARLELTEESFQALEAIVSKLARGAIPEDVPPLRTPSIMGAWCNLVGGGHLVATERFLKESASLPEEEGYLYRVAVALHGIARLTAGTLTSTGKDIALSLGVKVCPVGNTSGFDDYNFAHAGQRLRSDWHAKWGNGTDLRNAFRIYYHWDTSAKKAILQSIGAHLDNWSTN